MGQQGTIKGTRRGQGRPGGDKQGTKREQGGDEEGTKREQGGDEEGTNRGRGGAGSVQLLAKAHADVDNFDFTIRIRAISALVYPVVTIPSCFSLTANRRQHDI